jgi:hypothetical protein
MKRNLAALGLALALAACSTAQIQTGASAVQLACQDAMAAGSQAQASLKGGALDTANDIVANYVMPACGTADAIAKIAADPTTAEWLGSLSTQLKTLEGS